MNPTTAAPTLTAPMSADTRLMLLGGVSLAAFALLPGAWKLLGALPLVAMVPWGLA
jgi:hypothetical protein